MRRGSIDDLLVRFFAAFTSPRATRADFLAVVTVDFEHRLDGVPADLDGFLERHAAFHRDARSVVATFDTVRPDGDAATTVHRLSVRRRDGGAVRLIVEASYVVEAGSASQHGRAQELRRAQRRRGRGSRPADLTHAEAVGACGVEVAVTMADHTFGFRTRALHAGTPPDPTTGARAMPIYLSSSFVFDSAEHAAELFALRTYGNIYSRIGNPTVAAFEERMASLEGGLGAVAFASGLAAQLAAVLCLAQAGDHVVATASLYGGTITQFGVTLKRMGIDCTFVPGDDAADVRAAIRENTKLVYTETVGNPRGNVADIEALAAVAHGAGVPLVVDNTFATPALCRPLEWGADIVTHSATKFISGHGTVIAGVLVEAGRFVWGPKHPLLASPSPGYHDMNFAETFGEYAYLMRARTEVLRDIGASLSPMSAFMLIEGLETLPLRMAAHVANARAVVDFLRAREEVAWVNYAGLDDSPYNALARKYLPEGAGSIFTFGLRGGRAAGQAFIEGLELFSHVANVGDAKSLVIHPASTTHQQLTDDEMRAGGITPEMVRLSIGLEDPADLLWDLGNGLRAASAAATAGALA